MPLKRSRSNNLEISTGWVCPECCVNIKNPFTKGRLSMCESIEIESKGFLNRLCPSCTEEVVIFGNGCVIVGFADGEEIHRNWIDDKGTKKTLDPKITRRTCRYREQVEVRSRWHQGLSTHQIRKETGIPLERVEKLCQGFLKRS